MFLGEAKRTEREEDGGGDDEGVTEAVQAPLPCEVTESVREPLL